ncbi:hypothetical protein CDD83_500 [Cordyceps sp. RAO-2017]|nr:hypothetical protein CDD83_500 [Cordyceps sp. RAO-2017]
MDYLLAEVENLRGKIVFVLAGYRKPMESFFAHNPGLPSRFPIEMTFEDYSDGQLLEILQGQIKKRWDGAISVEGGMDGLFLRVASRRVGRGRGKEGFGNARAMENALARMEKRQAKRLRQERKNGRSGDDLQFNREDVIGPEPAVTLRNSQSWKQLEGMIGLKKVKQEVKFSLNRAFVGSPGTGKTTAAQLYGQVLADLGLLSNGEVVVKTPADFVGSALGQSEATTKGILAATVGKVPDPYWIAVVDIIVAEVQNVPGEDRCVILLGYERQMERMFRNVNPGLSRRFAADSPFVFEDFDDEELLQMLGLKLRASGFAATDLGWTPEESFCGAGEG